jgi:hypothetical protein
MIKTNKIIEREIPRKVFLYEVILDIDEKYFINQIESCLKEQNLYYKTNVKGQMTSWNAFNENEKFLQILSKFIFYVDQNITLPPYCLRESWGYNICTENQTLEHDHKPHIWSGVLYLNKHNQTLDFREINKKVKPEKGKFALFSSFLKHQSLTHYEKNNKWGISFNMGTSVRYENN